MGDLNKKTGEREVFFELNGQLRSVLIKDNAAMKVIKTLWSNQLLGILNQSVNQLNMIDFGITHIFHRLQPEI